MSLNYVNTFLFCHFRLIKIKKEKKTIKTELNRRDLLMNSTMFFAGLINSRDGFESKDISSTNAQQFDMGEVSKITDFIS